MSVSSSGVAESRDQTTQYMYNRLRNQQLTNPISFVGDATYEVYKNIIIAFAGNRTHAEQNRGKAAAEESIGYHPSSSYNFILRAASLAFLGNLIHKSLK